MPGRPPAWRFALTRAIHVLLVERAADIAATLAFFSALSVFPALLAVFGVFGLAGQGRHSADLLLKVAQRVMPSDLLSPLRSTVEHLSRIGGAGAGLGTVLALVVAIWTASRYVAGFTGAANRIYGVQEGRQFWKRRLVQLGITVAVVVLTAVMLFVLLFSGPLFGPKGIVTLGDAALMVWSVARWVIAAAAMLVIIVLLFWGTPNIRQPRLRWITAGGMTAMALMAAASAAFVFYVTNFSTFHREYGALAGLIVFLIWLWLMNLMLLFGVAYDVELERVRELKGGTDARRRIALPLRDERRIATLQRRDSVLAARAALFLPAGDGVARGRQHPVEGAVDAEGGRDHPGAAPDLVDDHGHA